MKAKKKPILITALSVLLCLSLVFGFMFENPMVAIAVSQPEDNEYTFDFGDKIHIVGWYGEWSEYAKPWEDATDTWWNDAVSIFNGYRWKTEPYMRWQNDVEDPDEELKHNFLAWYPEDFVTSNSKLTDIDINLTGDPEEDDILVAKWSGTRPEDDTLKLEFEHLLARFDLNIVFGSEYPDAQVVSVESWLPRTGKCNLLNNSFEAADIVAHNTYKMEKHPYPASGCDWSGSCITIPMTVRSMNFITIKCTNAGKEEYRYAHPTNIELKSGERTTLTLYIGKDVVELKQSATDDAYPGGWENEANLDGTIGTIGTADKGKTAWENEDKVYQHLNSSKYGNQTATLTFNGADGTWTSNGTLKYLENENPTVTAVYAPGCEIKSDNTIGLRDGQQYGMAEYIEANTNIDNDDALAVNFSPGRAYSRLRIVATPNETLTVTTTDFTPAGPNGTTAPESYTLTTDANGNAYLYGTFAAGGTVKVETSDNVTTNHSFGSKTEGGTSYTLTVGDVPVGAIPEG